MKVIIVVGGKGTRMQEISEELPKALLPVDGKPVSELIIDKLKAQGFTEVIWSIGHLGDKIKDYFGDGSTWGMNFEYALEPAALGTGGCLKFCEPYVQDEEDVLVIFGDLMLDMDFGKLIAFHKSKHAVITFCVHKSDHPEDSTNVKMDDDGKILSCGRPKHGHPITGITRTSVQVINKRIFEHIPEGKVSLEDDVVPGLMEKGLGVYGYYTEEFIKDMGTPKRYKQVGGRLES